MLHRRPTQRGFDQRRRDCRHNITSKSWTKRIARPPKRTIGFLLDRCFFFFLVRCQVVVGTPSVLCMTVVLLNKAFGTLCGHHRSIFSPWHNVFVLVLPNAPGNLEPQSILQDAGNFFLPLDFTCRNLYVPPNFMPSCIDLPDIAHASPKSKDLHHRYCASS